MAGTARTLLPDADALHLEELRAEGDVITVVASTARDGACCPGCGRASRRVHSRRRRIVVDLPWQGLAVRLELHFRRFSCATPTCARKTFTAPLPTVVCRYARRTRQYDTEERVAVGVAQWRGLGGRSARQHETVAWPPGRRFRPGQGGCHLQFWN